MKTLLQLGVIFSWCVGTIASAQTPAMKPGVTVWLYDIGTPMRELPILVTGQTPNVSADFAAVDFTGGWETTYGAPLEENYFGHAWGRLKIETGGTYEFRLTSDDGAKFFVGDEAALVIDNDQQGLNSRTATLNLLPGSFRYYVDFYQNANGSRLLLEWKPPGAAAFETVPQSALETEDGQTHVTSPGPKTYYYQDGEGGTAGGPGDGRPLTGVHPGFDLVNFRPASFRPAVGGMDFLPDGRLAVCTWDATGAVYLLDNLNGPGAVTVKRFAGGLGEPLGLRVIDGVIHVTQKQEVTKLLDHDGDDVADEYVAVAHGWPASFNYHEFSFNLVKKDGALWVATSVPLRTGSTAYLPGSEPAFPVPNGPGSLLKIDPEARTWEIMANGLRTPNGMGIGVDGELFGSDNQGDWLPSSRLNHLQPGKYYGHRMNPSDATDYTRPALWLPHGEISNSPAEPTLIPSGIYSGQMLLAELTHGGVNRVFMEKIKGVYQGAVFQFTQGLESGMNRLAWGPDGSLYVGGLGAGGNWNWNNTTSGLQRLRPNGRITFEMKSVKARADGFIIEFTQPVPYSVASLKGNYSLQQFRQTPESTYGGPKYNLETLTAQRLDISQDRRKVFLSIPGLKTDRVLALRLRNFINDANVAPWATEAWYTINRLPDETGPDFVPMDAPPEPEQPVVPEWKTTYEAEDATRAGPARSTEHPGFTGTGYADFGNATGETVTWTITTTHAGTHRVAFRYGNGATANRPLALRVNENVIDPAIPFSPSGGWPVWIETAGIEVQLTKGVNTIQLASTTATGPNVDHLIVTGPPPPPPGATVLFDGTASSAIANWRRDADGTGINWTITQGALGVVQSPAPNNISTIAGFQDYQLHLEWLSPAGGSGQLAGNSGVKLHQRYEIQILNSPADQTLANDSAGAIYLQKAPAINASLGAGSWQSYDIDFTAARWNGMTKVADARVTVRWNGILVHDNVALPDSTGGSPSEAPGLHSILLQAHATGAASPVKFRNIWVIPRNIAQEQWDAWLDETGLAEGDRTARGDPDGDGMENLWEYVSAADPLSPDRFHPNGQARTPAMTMVNDDGESYLEFHFQRRIDSIARGLEFSIQTSTTLDPMSWTNRPASQISAAVPAGDGITEWVTLRIDAPFSGPPALFARLRVELQD